MVKMITGDHLLIAKETARVLELGTFIRSADGLPLLDAETKAKTENLPETMVTCVSPATVSLR